ncbi:histidine phosphatase family protein [Clostridium polynesiense]|uniref:histidine phosphatase family protein n=1 Tax=Clostridium polynesiense TaxID=1325933 RepID=UPI0009E5044B|nr:histidine phosphatase family protein [Clostridium polynesiense]
MNLMVVYTPRLKLIQLWMIGSEEEWMYTNIYLIRHAEVNFTPKDSRRPLSFKGKRDALMLTELFRDYEISRIFSSPYLRAVDTVKEIAVTKGIDIEISENFRERKITEGYIKDFYAFTKKQWEDFDFHLEKGESINDVKRRGVIELRKILNKYKGENIIICTHGTILTSLINNYDESCSYDFWYKLKMPDAFKLTFEEKKLIKIENILNR